MAAFAAAFAESAFAASATTTAAVSTASASATTTVSTTATASAITAATAFTGGRGPGFVDGQFASVQFLIVHGADGGFGAGFVFHGHEREPAGTTRGAVHDDLNLADRPVLGECVLEVVFSGLERDVPDIELRAHRLILVLTLVVERMLPSLFPTAGFQIITNTGCLTTFQITRRSQSSVSAEYASKQGKGKTGIGLAAGAGGIAIGSRCGHTEGQLANAFGAAPGLVGRAGMPAWGLPLKPVSCCET